MSGRGGSLTGLIAMWFLLNFLDISCWPIITRPESALIGTAWASTTTGSTGPGSTDFRFLATTTLVPEPAGGDGGLPRQTRAAVWASAAIYGPVLSGGVRSHTIFEEVVIIILDGGRCGGKRW